VEGTGLNKKGLRTGRGSKEVQSKITPTVIQGNQEQKKPLWAAGYVERFIERNSRERSSRRH